MRAAGKYELLGKYFPFSSKVRILSTWKREGIVSSRLRIDLDSKEMDRSTGGGPCEVIIWLPKACTHIHFRTNAPVSVRESKITQARTRVHTKQDLY